MRSAWIGIGTVLASLGIHIHVAIDDDMGGRSSPAGTDIAVLRSPIINAQPISSGGWPSGIVIEVFRAKRRFIGSIS